MDVDKRQILKEIIRKARLTSQAQLQEALLQKGVQTTQASISRDLKKLGVVKRRGFYEITAISPGESSVVDRLDVDVAGDHLIILRTGPGNSPRAAVMIDEAKIAGVLGSISGDDTIFVAISDRKHQARVIREILDLFKRKEPLH